MFIIGTNEPDEKRLSDAQLLDVYKAQSVSVERGFRFLKDPMFYAESPSELAQTNHGADHGHGTVSSRLCTC